MKKPIVLITLVLFFSLFVLSGGCGESRNGDSTDENHTDSEVDRIEFDKGYAIGETEGYARGYSDGKEGVYNPVPPHDAGPEEHYESGYNEGWVSGYEKGQEDALEEAGDAEEEMAEVEAAMLDFVKSNAAPGLEFRIENIVIHGDEAAGIAVCTSEVLETPLVVMKKGSSGWYGVDFGTGIEPPTWYPY